LKKGISNSVVYDIKNFEERYNLKVDQFVDFKALKGDPSDNIPGVKGIGEKTAMEILQKYISLDNLYLNIDKYLNESSNAKDKKLLMLLKENEDEARFSKHLALIKKDIDIDVSLDQTRFDFAKKDEVIKFFKSKGFNSLVSKLNLDNFEDKKDQKKTDTAQIQISNNINDFIHNFDKEKNKMFVFENHYLNIKEEGLTFFFNQDNL